MQNKPMPDYALPPFPDFFKLPEPYRDAINVDIVIQFDLIDRLKILLGAPVKIKTFTLCENPPGQVDTPSAKVSVGLFTEVIAALRPVAKFTGIDHLIHTGQAEKVQDEYGHTHD